MDRWKRDADGWAVRRGEWMPVWLRISIRALVLLPLLPLHWAGAFAEWAQDVVDPYLPRGL